MRYSWLLVGFVVVLVAPLALRVALLSRARSVSPDQDAPRLVIISPHPEGIRREFADAFSAWHQEHFGQPVILDFRNYGGASEIVRYFQNSHRTIFQQHGTFKIDLVWGGGDYLFDTQLKKPGYLDGVSLDSKVMRDAYPTSELSGVALYDHGDPPQWFGTALSSFGIIYNRDVLNYLGVNEPTTWRDLADTRFRGWLVLADPTRSASAKQAFLIILQRAMADAAEQNRSEDAGWAEGMGLIRLIAANARMFTDGASAVPGIVSGGDAAAGMAIDFYGRSQVQAVGGERLSYIEPAGATAINPDPIALVKGAEHKELAIRFIEFVLSETGQRLWITRPGAPGGPRQTALRRLPIRRDVYDSPRDFTDPVNPFALAGSFRESPQRKQTSLIVGELIQISCMDLLEELKETRAAIQSSPRSAELDAQLGTFPFDQQEALRRQEQWKNSSPIEQLKLRRRWMEEFREEYRQLRQGRTRPHDR